MPLFFQENCSPPIIELNPEESKHLVRVLRKSTGDEVQVTDGLGKLYFCLIDQADQKRTRLLVKSEEEVPRPPYQINLVISPTKSPDRMEWMVEKITEIGFDKLYLMRSENSERSFLKTDRLEKKVIAACKQSLQFHKPEIETDWTFEQVIHSKEFSGFQKFIAFVDENHPNHLLDLAKPKQNYLMLIGPEGDFTPKEIQAATAMGFAPVSLGKNRLRTETAGLSAVQMLQILNR
ncbi:RsmE family RNA methyltransferase [Algoriphagus sp.]|uniref:RsmE family RNA methyltransferase n=1 Tax=Algoriphagus sp. TaxID=1872435 RepID=UPI002620E5D2|nr:RsmE family RNA methyltransferase [Algoriphagus sp.]